jgi:hypothetical protein
MGQMKTNSKKGATSADSRQQPLKIDRAATQTTQRKSITGAAELQLKMMEAAMKLVVADGEDDANYQRIDPTTQLPNVDLYIYQYFPMLHCTPKGVFLLYEWHHGEGWDFEQGWEWILLSPEYIAAAFKKTFSNIDEKLAAERLLQGIRKTFKSSGKVSWVLPKLPEGGVA